LREKLLAYEELTEEVLPSTDGIEFSDGLKVIEQKDVKRGERSINYDTSSSAKETYLATCSCEDVDGIDGGSCNQGPCEMATCQLPHRLLYRSSLRYSHHAVADANNTNNSSNINLDHASSSSSSSSSPFCGTIFKSVTDKDFFPEFTTLSSSHIQRRQNRAKNGIKSSQGRRTDDINSKKSSFIDFDGDASAGSEFSDAASEKGEETEQEKFHDEVEVPLDGIKSLNTEEGKVKRKRSLEISSQLLEGLEKRWTRNVEMLSST